VNFTRDPIIETVITPREGCKLVVRSSKGTNQEDYLVDALEVVSFGHSFFFRSQERPKSFLVPVSDYEIFESKEPKMLLKNATAERSIKIGGGRDVPPRHQREVVVPEIREEVPTQNLDRGPNSDRGDRKQRDKQRRRGRRGRDRHDAYGSGQEGGESFSPREESSSVETSSEVEHEVSSQVEAPKEKAPSFISKLFPPPTTLIKETLSRYKSVDPASEDLFPMNSKESVSLEENSSFEDGNPDVDFKNSNESDQDTSAEE
jgi:hypothetical protein